MEHHLNEYDNTLNYKKDYDKLALPAVVYINDTDELKYIESFGDELNDAVVITMTTIKDNQRVSIGQFLSTDATRTNKLNSQYDAISIDGVLLDMEKYSDINNTDVYNVTCGYYYTFPTAGLHTLIYYVKNHELGVFENNYDTLNFLTFGMDVDEQYVLDNATVYIKKGITSIGGRALLCSSFQNIIYEGGAVTLNKNAFAGSKGGPYTNIKNIVLPEGTTTIGQLAFRYSNLEYILIPTTVTSIQGYAFKDCPNLNKTLNYAGKIEDWNNISFTNASPYDITDVICTDGVKTYN